MVDDSTQNQINMSEENDADFGLPDVTLVPIERAGGGRSGGASKRSRNQQNNRNSNVPLIVGAVILLLAGLVALWQFWLKDVAFNKDTTANVPAIEDTTTTTNNNNVIDDNGVDPNAAVTDDGATGDDGIGEDDTTSSDIESNTFDTATGTTGEMELVTTRTRRTYVIIGSFFDEDLAKDYAKQLGKTGVSTKLISPLGGKKFYRLSVADFATISEASNSLEDLKATHGENLWIIKH